VPEDSLPPVFLPIIVMEVGDYAEIVVFEEVMKEFPFSVFALPFSR
jgi:hypothetical protein